ncbi:hypothetical protein CERSUDRAFT_95197 [Gelatoporia subvermispora B]|uniref:Uncharacterized protein n=1 Tax=Ceriporiopsis subvermispora (strain B) TaxID=914234 RepID=M2QXS8_CERS8|nr:hypothetical protein CERSUDRAFT_95197 [Gelatoporia subvermispora B]
MPNARNHAIKEAAIRARLPELVPATGPPLAVEESFTAVSAVPAGQDPRLTAVSMGFPISVHPLRLPNSRGTLSTGSTTSLIDTRCVRLAGLLARMVPIRPIDEVHISTLFGGQHMNVFGRVDVTFDAFGFEFSTPCWVVNLGLPVDIALGMDWLETYNPKISWRQELEITDANAKKVRKLVDIYVTE